MTVEKLLKAAQWALSLCNEIGRSKTKSKLLPEATSLAIELEEAIEGYKAASSNTVAPVDNIVESEEKYVMHDGERYVNESYVIKEFVPAFLRKMLTDGRIKIVEGNKDYFTKILDEPTDIFNDFIPENKEVSTNPLK